VALVALPSPTCKCLEEFGNGVKEPFSPKDSCQKSRLNPFGTPFQVFGGGNCE